jgi:hypothetical protein
VLQEESTCDVVWERVGNGLHGVECRQVNVLRTGLSGIVKSNDLISPCYCLTSHQYESVIQVRRLPGPIDVQGLKFGGLLPVFSLQYV